MLQYSWIGMLPQSLDQTIVENEIWKWVVGYEEYYKVSNYGRIKRVKNINYTVKFGVGWRKIRLNREILKTGKGQYPRITLTTKVKRERFNLHIVVLLAFRGPCPDGMESCHKDDDRTNNNINNLYWGTRSNNIYDAIRNGKKPSQQGESHSQVKLNKIKVKKIRKLYKSGGYSRSQLGDKFDVTKACIQAVVEYRSWKHIK